LDADLPKCFADVASCCHNSLITSTRQIASIPRGSTDSHLGRIVRLLADHATVVVSGTKIAGELHTSRSEVWRLVQQLRVLGLEIAGHPATGYQLKKVPDLLLPEFLAPLLKETIFGGRMRHYFKIASTNASAMQAAAAGEPEGTLFIAEEQTAGRGRGGHTWHSPRSGGIYCSFLLRPQLAPADALLLPLAAGLATSAAVEQVTGLRPDLRWPNDLLLGGKKFCGILAEMNAEATRVRYAVVGIGMNVNQMRFPADLQSLATSLRLESGQEWSRLQVAAALLKSLHRECVALTRSARGCILRRFQERSSYTCGKLVHVEEDGAGGGGYEGITEGLDARGFLQVKTQSGLRTVISGGVRELPED